MAKMCTASSTDYHGRITQPDSDDGKVRRQYHSTLSSSPPPQSCNLFPGACGVPFGASAQIILKHRRELLGGSRSCSSLTPSLSCINGCDSTTRNGTVQPRLASKLQAGFPQIIDRSAVTSAGLIGIVVVLCG